MRTEQTTIIPIDVPVVTPIQVARRCYLKWKATPSFERDLVDYLENGIVISRPDIFAMAKIIEVEGGSACPQADASGPDNALGTRRSTEQTLFVRVAVGSLRKLLCNLPVLLPTICFCRRNEPRMRRYSLVRFLQVTDKLIKKEHSDVE
jgi:hypothetical protein